MYLGQANSFYLEYKTQKQSIVDLNCRNRKLLDEKLSPTPLSLNPTFSLESIFSATCLLASVSNSQESLVSCHPISPFCLCSTVSFHNLQLHQYRMEASPSLTPDYQPGEGRGEQVSSYVPGRVHTSILGLSTRQLYF